jgi:hypothetical protein
MPVYTNSTEILLAPFNFPGFTPVWGVILKIASSSDAFYPDISAGVIASQIKPSHYALSYLDHMSVSSASSAGTYVDQARSIIKKHPFGYAQSEAGTAHSTRAIGVPKKLVMDGFAILNYTPLKASIDGVGNSRIERKATWLNRSNRTF